jgi:transposase
MPAERITMRQAREIIRLKAASVSAHEISWRLGMSRSTVREALERAEGAGLSWPLPEGMNDDALEAALYANERSKRGHRRVEEPDWAGVHRELKRKQVTLTILWDEYIAGNPGRLSLLALLRAVSRLREDAVGDDAADARRRRALVRRLRWRRRSCRL